VFFGPSPEYGPQKYNQTSIELRCAGGCAYNPKHVLDVVVEDEAHVPQGQQIGTVLGTRSRASMSLKNATRWEFNVSSLDLLFPWIDYVQYSLSTDGPIVGHVLRDYSNPHRPQLVVETDQPVTATVAVDVYQGFRNYASESSPDDEEDIVGYSSSRRALKNDEPARLLAVSYAAAVGCRHGNIPRQNCLAGKYESDPEGCVTVGCCWGELHPNPRGLPQCFNFSGHVPGPPPLPPGPSPLPPGPPHPMPPPPSPPALVDVASVDVNWLFKRSIGGVSDFRRERHITVHSSITDNDWRGEMDKMDELMNGMDAYFGRDNGIANFQFTTTRNDSVVHGGTGKPDTFSVAAMSNASLAFKRLYANNYTDRLPYEYRQKGMIMGTIPHPTYPTLDWNPPGFTLYDHWQPKNITTSAAWAEQFLDEFFRESWDAGSEAGMPLPKYWEVINEPDMELMTGQFMVTSWEALWEYHNVVAKGVKARMGDRAPMIGGMTFGLHDLNEPDQPRHDADYLRKWIPTKAAADMYEKAGTTAWPRTGQPWEQWDKIWKNYIDICGANTDFYSIHLYDWPSWKGQGPPSGGHVRTGGHVEALLDMVEWYDVYTHGNRKPVIVSEYGAVAGAFQKLEGLDRLRMAWELLKPMSGMLMQFLKRPDWIEKTMPFTPIKASWGDYRDANGVLHRYASSLLDNSTSTDGVWRWTGSFMFYQLWSDVNGTRVDTHCANLDVQTEAFVDEKHRNMFLIINNLASNSTVVSLNQFGITTADVEAVEIKHLFLDTSLGKQGGQPVLSIQNLTALPQSVTVGPEATMIIKQRLKQSIHANETSTERKFLGDSLSGGTAPHRLTGSSMTTHVRNVSVPAGAGEALLRVGGQFWGSAIYVYDPERNFCSINGHALVFPQQFMGSLERVQRWFGVLMMQIPLEYLQTDNVVECTVVQDNVYTTVSISTWEFSAKPGRTADSTIRTGATSEAYRSSSRHTLKNDDVAHLLEVPYAVGPDARPATRATLALVAPLTVRLRPSDCLGAAAATTGAHMDSSSTAELPDCHAALASAVARCRTHRGHCTVELAPGVYRVGCPAVQRPSSAMIEGPAVALNRLTGGFVFGGTPGLSAPELLIDYTNGGCAAIVAVDSSDVTVRHLTIDSLRLPYTVGTVTAATTSTVSFKPEEDEGDRLGVYHWDRARYPWLDGPLIDSFVVPPGERAVRERASWGGTTVPHTSSVHNISGVVSMHFADTNPRRAQLKPGQRIYMLHFENMQSWGVHGHNVSGSMTVSNVSLFSTSGMGYRCDLCSGHYALLDSTISLRPGTLRPLSITADAIHFMHHSGSIEVRRSSMQAQGDDGLNVHTNFVILDELRGHSNNTVGYIDETGPGWITGFETALIGDRVQFYSRRTLEKLGQQNTITAATTSTISFAKPLPARLKRYDMLLSVDRIASIEIEDCFFGNSNARGLVLSTINATVKRCTFANLSLPGLIFMEGGCGAVAGDYTEGPLSENVLVQDNEFLSTASVNSGYPRKITNAAQLQIAACVPIGECGLSGGLPCNRVNLTPHWFPPTPTAAANTDKVAVIRVQEMALPGGPTAVQNPTVMIRALKYGATAPVPGVEMAIYSARTEEGSSGSSSQNRPAKLLARTSASNTWAKNGIWMSTKLPEALSLTNASYFLAHWYPAAASVSAWDSFAVPGSFLEMPAPGGLPDSLLGNASSWRTVADTGLPVAVDWTSEGDWCDVGGTLPPPVLHKPNDRGAGRLTERGALLSGGRTALRNITIVRNTFLAPSLVIGRQGQPYTSTNAFINAGAVDGLTVSGNRMMRHLANTNNATHDDMSFYSDTNVVTSNNTCFAGGRAVVCRIDHHLVPDLDTTTALKIDDDDNVAAAEAVTPDKSKRPHVLFIVADDLGFADLGFTGSDILTPRIDKLASEGIILGVRAVCHRVREKFCISIVVLCISTLLRAESTCTHAHMHTALLRHALLFTNSGRALDWAVSDPLRAPDQRHPSQQGLRPRPG
jgi:hypothetical protein